MLQKTTRRYFVPPQYGREARAEVTVCTSPTPSQPGGSWTQVCSNILVEVGASTAVPPGGEVVSDGEGKPIIYQQNGKLYAAYRVCRTEWVAT